MRVTSSALPTIEAALPARWGRRVWLLVLAGGIVMGMALGIRHIQGLFLLPITLDRGWTRESFSYAMAVQNLTWGIAQPFAGMIADRLGAGNDDPAKASCFHAKRTTSF